MFNILKYNIFYCSLSTVAIWRGFCLKWRVPKTECQHVRCESPCAKIWCWWSVARGVFSIRHVSPQKMLLHSGLVVHQRRPSWWCWIFLATNPLEPIYKPLVARCSSHYTRIISKPTRQQHCRMYKIIIFPAAGAAHFVGRHKDRLTQRRSARLLKVDRILAKFVAPLFTTVKVESPISP